MNALITARWANRMLRLPATLTTVTEGDVDDMNRPTDHTVDKATRCYYEAKTSSEVTGGQIVGTVNYTAWLPACEDVTGADRMTILGAEYEVVGPARPLVHPHTGENVAWELDLVRTA